MRAIIEEKIMNTQELAKQVLDVVASIDKIRALNPNKTLAEVIVLLEQLQKLAQSQLPQEFEYDQIVQASNDGETWRLGRYYQRLKDGLHKVRCKDYGYRTYSHVKPDPDGEREEYERLKKRLGIKNIESLDIAEAIEKAHMQGQAESGVDPSFLLAQNYRRAALG